MRFWCCRMWFYQQRNKSSSRCFAQTLGAVFFEQVNVAQVGEGRSVGDHSGQPDLLAVVVEPETERACEAALDQLERDSGCPIGAAQ